MLKNNPYINDSLIFFEMVSRNIKQDLSNAEVIGLTLYLALGLERILKGILFSINPLYILKNPDFKNSLPIFYHSKVITESTGSPEIAQPSKIDEDVITFKLSLLKAQVVSKTTFDNKNLLFVISNARDIIAHHELSKLDYEGLKTLLLRDYYSLMKGYIAELSLKANYVFYGKHIQLAKLSSKLQETIEKQIELKFEAHIATFEIMKKNPGYLEDKKHLTYKDFNKGNSFITTCPCCRSEAIIHVTPIFEAKGIEIKDLEVVHTGYHINNLKCYYCKIELTDYKELDYLKISVPTTEIQEEITEKCPKCGESFNNDKGIDICPDCNEHYGKE